MSERYSRLFSLQENLYSEGSPVVIAAGALLKDNETGKVLAQIKLRSISDKAIKAATVGILPFDVAGNPIGDDFEYQYLDLSASRDAEFGQKTPIVLPDAPTRAYAAIVSKVIFDDNSIWCDTGSAWKSLPVQKTLAGEFEDNELVKQFKLKFGGRSEYVFREEKDLWLCACGGVNHCGEAKCHSCGANFNALKAFDLNELKADCEARLAEEKKQAEIAAAEAKAATKKAGKIAAVCIAVAVVIIAAALLTTKVIIPNGKYNDAVALMDAGQYEDAIAAFGDLGAYKDSEDQIVACKYAHAIALMNSNQYVKAIAIFESLGGYEDSVEQLNTCKYSRALELKDAGNIIEAYEAFAALGNYKDSELIASSMYDEYKHLCFIADMKQSKTGDYISFGSYEQDNDKTNGAEEIEWLVLEKQEDKVLVISKYALDCQQYNKEYEAITWEKCTLRSWLNNEFLAAAFSETERAIIPTVTVSADKNSDYNTNTGKATQDKVFLLSITEANKYFASDAGRLCKPTAYAEANGVFFWNGGCFWWLRSPGYRQDYAASVFSRGAVDEAGTEVDADFLAVRPALWIDISE